MKMLAEIQYTICGETGQSVHAHRRGRPDMVSAWGFQHQETTVRLSSPAHRQASASRWRWSLHGAAISWYW
jgi:hypothetical protein